MIGVQKQPASTTRPATNPLSDGVLLEQFLCRRDKAALTAIIERFSGVVWKVCRRVLPRTEDAEDAFQAVFLILSRSGQNIRNKGAVGSWLYGVAYRTAMKARRDLARRKRHEAGAALPPSEPGPAGAAICRELHLMLDQEVNRLPEKLRIPFVQCCVEGASKSEAARELGLCEGTVSSRLDKARKLLKSRLARQGVTLSAALTVLAVTQGSAAAAPPLLVHSTIAGLSASLTTKAVVGLSPASIHLADGIMRSLAIAKLKLAGMVLVAAGMVTGGIAVAENQLIPKPAAPAGPALTSLPEFVGPPIAFGEAIDEQVLSIAFSPDGNRLVTAGARWRLPGQIVIWDVATHQRVATAHKVRGTRSVAISPNGQTIACGESGGDITLRDGLTGESRGTLRGHSIAVNCVAYSRDGGSLLSAGLDGTIKLWNLKTPNERKTFRDNSKGFFSVAWFGDGKRFVTGGREQTATIWDSMHPATKIVLAGHQSTVEAAVVSPDDKLVATASWDGTIRLWDADTGAVISTLSGHRSAVFSVAFSPDGSLLASSSADGEVRLWDAKTYQPIAILGRHNGNTWSVAFSPNGKLLASGSSDTTAKIWDVESKAEVTTLATSESRPIRAVAYSSNSKLLAVARERETPHLYDTRNGNSLRALATASTSVTALAFSPADNSLAIASTDKPVSIWDAFTGVERRVLETNGGPASSLAYSPNGKRLASAGPGNDIVIWDVDSGKLVRTCRGHASPIRALAFSLDGAILASAGDDQSIRIWNPDGDSEPVVLAEHNGPIRSLIFVGSELVSAGDSEFIAVWTPAEGKSPWTGDIKPRKLPARRPITALAALPDRKGFVSGSKDGTILQWDGDANTAGNVLSGHQFPVTTLAIRPDETELLSGSLDGHLLRWPAAGRQIVNNATAANNNDKPPAEAGPISELFQDFRHRQLPKVPLSIYGAKAATVTHADERGLHITVQPNPEQTQRIGLTLDRPIRGDFEITAGYEIVRVDLPKGERSAGVCLMATLDSTQGEVLELMRAAGVNRGQAYGCSRKTVRAGKDNYDQSWIATTSVAGHLRLTRSGNQAIYSVRDGGSEVFKELARIDCSTDEVKQLRFAAYMGFVPNSVDVFLKDLRIARPDNASTARVIPEPSEPVTPAPKRGRLLPYLSGIVGFAMLLAAIRWLVSLVRRRKETGQSPQIAKAKILAAKLSCSGCRKQLVVRPEHMGNAVKCPRCGTRLTTPDSAVEAT